MLSFMIENGATILVCAAVGAVLALTVWRMVKKKGSCPGCSGGAGCSGCPRAEERDGKKGDTGDQTDADG